MMTMMMGESIVCIQGNGDDGMMLLLQNWSLREIPQSEISFSRR
jgi:hypothetical protein